ncbi:glucose 1-dehydrogenase [Paracidovorax citrulli]
MQQRLLNEIAIVTGSDSGIGQATAIAFAREGADVVITYHSDAEGAERTREAVMVNNRRALVVQLDQSDPASVTEFFRTVREQLGVPTILVNNAGINANGVPVKDLSDEDWDRTIRTNLYGPFYCCREFIRGLDGSDKHGTIINVTSVHQEIPMPGASAYDASKGGLRNLTTTLALELSEKNINVNNIAPGMILTPMNQEAMDDPAKQEKQVQSIPMKRAGKPEEIASVAVFLASDQASYIQGATIVVDGGLVLFQGQGA